MKLKTLVTGGAGFIGSHAVDLLVGRGRDVVVLDNLDPQVHGPGATEPRYLADHRARGAIRFIQGDVTSRADLSRALDGVDTVVHLAAAVGVGQSMYSPYYYVHTNSTGSGLLLDLVVQRRDSIRKLVVASSMSLYGEGAYACSACGGSGGRERDEAQLAAGRWEVLCVACGATMEACPTPETKVPRIASVYAATKKHQEDLFVSLGRAYSISTFALRFFNVFGPRQSLANPYTGVAAIFLSRLLNRQSPLIFEDGLQSRDFIDVRDVARALMLAVESSRPGAHVLNVGTGRRTTIEGVAQYLAAHLSLDLEPQLLEQYRAGDIRHCYSDPTVAKETLGFEARYSLEDGLPDLVEWCRNEKPPDFVERSLSELRDEGLVR